MAKNKTKRRTSQRVSARQFVAHVKAKQPIQRVETHADVPAEELKASQLISLVLLLANVQNNYFDRAGRIMTSIGKSHNHEMKRKISLYIAELQKLKGMSAELTSIITNLHGREEDSFNNDSDYLEELIPLFIDRIGDDSRTDYVAQCILQNIYCNYTSKLHQFEEHGHKHLTRTKTEAGRMRKINAWRRNQQAIKKAVLAGIAPPPELPWPFPELNKQMYLDF